MTGGRCWVWDRLPADALSHVADALQYTEDRQSARSVCKAWRVALDGHWRRGCFLSRMLNNPTDKAARLLSRFKVMQRLLWPRLRQLDLVELNAQRASILLSELTPTNFPLLTYLGLSSALQEHCADGGKLARLQLPLQDLCLYNIRVKGGLASLSHLRQLTALHVSSTISPGGGGSPLDGPEVRCLTALTRLQALSLPSLNQDARQALSTLSPLTALAFGAAGSGAVGSNLLPLHPSLRRLRVELHHRRECCLVMHPALEWEALAQLTALTSLELLSWAAGRRNTAPVLSAPHYVWADQSAAEEQAAVLLAGVPSLASLRITAEYCTLDNSTQMGAPGSPSQEEREQPAPREGSSGGAEAARGEGRGGEDGRVRAAGLGGPPAAADRGASAPRQWTTLGAAVFPLGAAEPAAGCTRPCGSGEGCEGEEMEEVCDSRGRWWVRHESRVPLERAGSRRGEGWYSAWWQQDVQSVVQGMFGASDPSLLAYRAEAFNVHGWVAIRPGSPATFDIELEYSLCQR